LQARWNHDSADDAPRPEGLQSATRSQAPQLVLLGLGLWDAPPGTLGHDARPATSDPGAGPHPLAGRRERYPQPKEAPVRSSAQAVKPLNMFQITVSISGNEVP